MSGITKIEWADRVWNPISGCTKCSPANCGDVCRPPKGATQVNNEPWWCRVGKIRAGRVLDGRTWEEVPHA